MNNSRKIPISPNLYRGHRITNPTDILELALNGESVCFWYGVNSYHVKPAAFVISMRFKDVVTHINRGQIYFVHQ